MAGNTKNGNGSGEDDQIRKTEWSKQRSGGELWAGDARDTATKTFAGRTAAIVTGSIAIGSGGCASESGVTVAARIGWMLQSLEVGAFGVFPQCPTGLQQPASELGNMKY